MNKKTPYDMLLIEKSKKGRKNGAYTRLFNNALIGSLFSQIHATTISSGSAIENLIYEQLENNKRIIYQFKNFKDFYLMPKDKIYFLSVKKLEKNKLLPFKRNKNGEIELRKNKEPKIYKQDFYAIHLEKNKDAILYLIELKTGETFDTKKLKGETDVLNICQTHFKNKLKNNFKIIQFFVCYDQESKDEIILGTKNFFSTKSLLSGKEFCKKFQINWKKIECIRKNAAKKNMNFLNNNFKNHIK